MAGAFNPYRVQRSSTRGARTDTKKPKVKGVATGPASSPVLQPSALAQGSALAAGAPPQMQWAPPESQVREQVENPPFYRPPIRPDLYGAYQAGGFQGVTGQAGPDWYSLPDWQRKQILDSARFGPNTGPMGE